MISGERIQELCDVYCGLYEDLHYNPVIKPQVQKHIYLDQIHDSWNNPKKLFCHTHRLENFIHILPFIENDFILITHNSDWNITEIYVPLLEHPKLIFWHAQNVLFHHPKLGSLPIGIANSMWPHGNLGVVQNVLAHLPEKTECIYFNFSLSTNPRERGECYEALKGKLVWQPTLPFESYLRVLSTYTYAICPPGNGVDCHRIWECIYLGVIPIVLRSIFTENLSKKFACILLDRWEDIDIVALHMYVPRQNTPSFKDLVRCIDENIGFL
jgi:hypothetical protein